MINDETAGRATGGVIPPESGATADRPPAGMSGCHYNDGGIINPGIGLFRNDTGRRLGLDELHLLTYVGPIPAGVNADEFIKWISFEPGEKLYTAAEFREMGHRVGQRVLDEIHQRLTDVDEGRAVPASPTAEVVPIEDVPAGGNTVTLGFDATAAGETTLVAVDADGKLVQW